MPEFGSVLNCIDGRVQVNVAQYLTARFSVRWIDAITAPGIVQHVAEVTDRTGQILDDLAISLIRHESNQIAIAAHAGCLGNPKPEDFQKAQLAAAFDRVTAAHPTAEVEAIYVNDENTIERVRAA